MLLLSFSVVIALQAVGVVLVSAMLITPAAAAYLLTDRMHVMLLLASIFGVAAGAAGAFFSWQQPANRPIDGCGGVVGVRVGVPFWPAPRGGIALVAAILAIGSSATGEYPESCIPCA
jgi:manganese/zinc/iron transport system permease protein